MFLHLSVSHSVHRGVLVSVRGSLGGSLSGGLCLRSLSRGVSVQGDLCPEGVSIQGGLCLGVSVQGVSVWGWWSLSGGSLSGGSLSGGSPSGGLCLGERDLCPRGSLSGGSLSRGVSVGDTHPTGMHSCLVITFSSWMFALWFVWCSNWLISLVYEHSFLTHVMKY